MAGNLAEKLGSLRQVHAPVVQTVVPVRSPDRAMELMREALRKLEQFYPAGAMEWLREFRPELVENLRESQRLADAAISDGDLDASRRSLSVVVDEHRRAFDVFRSRAAVDVMGDLF